MTISDLAQSTFLKLLLYVMLKAERDQVAIP